MSRFVTNITNKKDSLEQEDMAIAILSAGTGNRIRSYEPRSLLKIGTKCLIEHQINTIGQCFDNPEIINVVGCHAKKVIKKIKGKLRIVENQLHETSNSSESLRLAFNNTTKENILFMHGDLYFNENTLKNLDYSKSFVIIDTKQQIKDNEVGVTIQDNRATILSYGLPTKWAQIAFIRGREYRMLKNIFAKYEDQDKKRLSFEVINMIISTGGKFLCHEPEQMSILEIDRIKDIR
jgi:choline kinase